VADPRILIHRYALPATAERGADYAAVLAASFPSGAGVPFVDTGWTYAIYAGSKLVYSKTSPGFTATSGTLGWIIPGAALASEALSDKMQERWTGPINSIEYTFTRPFHLVRHALMPAITDVDLTALHSDLLDLKDPDQATFETQRVDAWNTLQKWLIMKGNRPQLILDDWAVRDVHRFLALENIFRDFGQSAGPDGRYAQLADHYRERAREEFSGLNFAYDYDQDGFDDGATTKAANPVTLLTVPWGWNR